MDTIYTFYVFYTLLYFQCWRRISVHGNVKIKILPGFRRRFARDASEKTSFHENSAAVPPTQICSHRKYYGPKYFGPIAVPPPTPEARMFWRSQKNISSLGILAWGGGGVNHRSGAGRVCSALAAARAQRARGVEKL